MHAICLCTSSLHFSSATDASAFKKQSSRADLVSGHAQHLRSRRQRLASSRGERITHGLRPFGFKGFCFGSVGSYGLSWMAGAEDPEPPHHELIWFATSVPGGPLCLEENIPMQTYLPVVCRRKRQLRGPRKGKQRCGGSDGVAASCNTEPTRACDPEP